MNSRSSKQFSNPSDGVERFLTYSDVKTDEDIAASILKFLGRSRLVIMVDVSTFLTHESIELRSPFHRMNVAVVQTPRLL